uniref:Heteropteran venom family 5 protein 1 n=1 Tax=Oncocephalus sp. TaxID=2944721 RepID=A0AB38ZEI3_9HEMI
MACLTSIIVLIFGTVSVFGKTVLVNEAMDKKLAVYNEAAAKQGYFTMPIVDIEVEGVSIKNARLGYLQNLKRESDVYRDTGDDYLAITGRFSMQPIIITAGELSYNGYTGPANITIDKLAADIAFKSSNLKEKGDCETTWSKFQVLPLNEVVLHTSDPALNNKQITEDVNNNVLPKLNNLFESNSLLEIFSERFDFCDIILGISHL